MDETDCSRRQTKQRRHVEPLIRRACGADLPQVAELFLMSFAETIEHLFGEDIPGRPALREALQDFFGFLLQEEPDAFRVIKTREDTGPRLAGYIVVSPDLINLWRRAVWGGYIFRWAAKLLRGAYGLKVKDLGRLLANKLSFWRFSRFQPCRAQILSLAVAENCRCRGFGRALLQKGVAYLHRHSRHRIKLEVRPWNSAAVHLYESCGFVRAGTTRDTQGEWMVMIAADSIEPSPGKDR